MIDDFEPVLFSGDPVPEDDRRRPPIQPDQAEVDVWRSDFRPHLEDPE